MIVGSRIVAIYEMAISLVHLGYGSLFCVTISPCRQIQRKGTRSISQRDPVNEIAGYEPQSVQRSGNDPERNDTNRKENQTNEDAGPTPQVVGDEKETAIPKTSRVPSQTSGIR